ncbi:hypothetical protein WDU94_002623 [Cyamophila willieti]
MSVSNVSITKVRVIEHNNVIVNAGQYLEDKTRIVRDEEHEAEKKKEKNRKKKDRQEEGEEKEEEGKGKKEEEEKKKKKKKEEEEEKKKKKMMKKMKKKRRRRKKEREEEEEKGKRGRRKGEEEEKGGKKERGREEEEKKEEKGGGEGEEEGGEKKGGGGGGEGGGKRGRRGGGGEGGGGGGGGGEKLLTTDPKKRLSNAVDLTRHSCLQKFNMDTVMEKQIKPGFTPPRDHLNCDPTFELEEMIVEARPLHKKKKRLAKQRSLKQSSSIDIQESDLEEQLAEFRVYNRERELIRRALEKKENDWEAELIQAMNESTITSCEVKPKLSQEEAPSQDSSNAPSTLLNLPPSILLDQRRRSSCKLSVSPLSVQTRLAASPQRNKEVKQTSETVSNSNNKPKKKVLNRQQTLQRLPYINVNEIITVDSNLLEETSEKAGNHKTSSKNERLGKNTIDEETKESGTCDTQQIGNESEMSLANVLIEIDNLNRKDTNDENGGLKSENCDSTKENQEKVATNDETGVENSNENQTFDESTKIGGNNYNYELTRFKVTKSENEKTHLSRQEVCDSTRKTNSQLEKHVTILENTKECDEKGDNKMNSEKSKDILGTKNDISKNKDSKSGTKTGINEDIMGIKETDKNTGDGKEDHKSDGQISTLKENNETDNKENETNKIKTSNDTKSATSETQMNPMTLPNISISCEHQQTESKSKDTTGAPKSPLRSDRSPNRSPMRSPKLGEIPTRSVLKNSLYRTDSTDSTKSLEKSPKKSYKVSFSCDVEDNSIRPKSPTTKLHGNSKSLDTECEDQQSPSKKEKKKK